jgi:hypothetical protein
LKKPFIALILKEIGGLNQDCRDKQGVEFVDSYQNIWFKHIPMEMTVLSIQGSFVEIFIMH